nr:hypothetical protein Iba_chr03eCG11010 [Ipomoea batatas]
MEKLSGTSSGNPRKSLEDEDLMERSVKKKSKTQKAKATDATDETMEDAPTVDQSLGDPIANSEGGQIPTDETKKVDEPKGAASSPNIDIRERSPEGERVSYKEKLAGNASFVKIQKLMVKRAGNVEPPTTNQPERRPFGKPLIHPMPTVIRPEVTEGYGSWMLAKRKERRFVQGSNGRQQGSEASGNNRKSKHGTNEGGSGRENNPHVKTLGQSSRFGVLYGLDDPTEQMEPTYVEKTKSGLTNQGTFRDKGKKPVKQPTREHSDIDTDKALPKDKSGRNGGNYKGESSGTKTGNYKGEPSGTKTRPKSRHAAAETEHTLVIGSRGGETVRYTVQEDIPPNESDWAMEEWGDWREHPNDPPHYGALEDDMEEEYFVEYG